MIGGFQPVLCVSAAKNEIVKAVFELSRLHVCEKCCKKEFKQD